MGVNAEVLDSGCCGMAGSFGFEKRALRRLDEGGRARAAAEGPQHARGQLIIASGFSCREQIEQSRSAGRAPGGGPGHGLAGSVAASTRARKARLKWKPVVAGAAAAALVAAFSFARGEKEDDRMNNVPGVRTGRTDRISSPARPTERMEAANPDSRVPPLSDTGSMPAFKFPSRWRISGCTGAAGPAKSPPASSRSRRNSPA